MAHQRHALLHHGQRDDDADDRVEVEPKRPMPPKEHTFHQWVVVGWFEVQFSNCFLCSSFHDLSRALYQSVNWIRQPDTITAMEARKSPCNEINTNKNGDSKQWSDANAWTNELMAQHKKYHDVEKDCTEIQVFMIIVCVNLQKINNNLCTFFAVLFSFFFFGFCCWSWS